MVMLTPGSLTSVARPSTTTGALLRPKSSSASVTRGFWRRLRALADSGCAKIRTALPSQMKQTGAVWGCHPDESW